MGESLYLLWLREILNMGEKRTDRTGVGTYSIFAPKELKFDHQYGFPLLTTKKIHWKSVVGELLWFLSGSTNIRPLVENGVSIWNEWADDEGELGPVYGKQWRDFNGVDQISNLIAGLKATPESRRHIVSAWNPVDVPNMALPPCHMMFQCYVRQDKYLDLKMYQRSADAFLGVPFNIASYALLQMMIAAQTGYEAGKLTLTFGDAHVYQNHVEQVNEQITRVPRAFPKVNLRSYVKSIFDYTTEDIALDFYNPYPPIKAPIAV